MWVEISCVVNPSSTLSVILFVRMWVEMKKMWYQAVAIEVILFVRMWVEMIWQRKHRRSGSVILFVRMWVEISYGWIRHRKKYVILFVRMWVEMFNIGKSLSVADRSSSSWGCELKCSLNCLFAIRYSHPLREDVSWNDFLEAREPFTARHPLREDVSWNIRKMWTITFGLVILFVRMWVEILKVASVFHRVNVILFVRMWVEILMNCQVLWRTVVILFVRMWVEMKQWDSTLDNRTSSSSWGCELKFFSSLFYSSLGFRHPLREDVSWNTSPPLILTDISVILFVRMWVEMMNAWEC